MPDKKTIEKARKDKREGKSASTQAGEFVHAEIDKVRQDKHGARSTKQAIAIGLSEARRAGVDLPPPKKGDVKETTRKSAEYAYEAGQGERKPKRQPKVSKAVSKVLEGEPKSTPRTRPCRGRPRAPHPAARPQSGRLRPGKPRRPKAPPDGQRLRARQPEPAPSAVRAFHSFMETANRSISLSLRNSERKTVSHFSWNCSRRIASQATPTGPSAAQTSVNRGDGFCR